MQKRKAVFLDRDGVINECKVVKGRPFPPDSLSELIILPKVKDAIDLLRLKGYLIIIVTNQPDVARGSKTRKSVEEIHDYLKSHLSIDDIYTCFHDDSDNCGCRKPKPGMILSAAKTHNLDLTSSFMVGDRWRDIESGELAGVGTIFIDYKYTEKRPKKFCYKANSLFEAIPYLVNKDVTDEYNFKP